MMETCAWLMHGTAEISRLAGTPATREARELAVRIENGASRELLDLIALSGVGRVRARRLYDAGFTSREKLKGAELATLAAVPGIGDKLAASILNQLGRKIEGFAAPEPESSQAGQSTLLSFND
jgi:helicase